MNTQIEWQFAGSAIDGSSFEIGGLDVWKHGWRDRGERARVVDPLYHQEFLFSVYEIGDSDATVTFAAGEFSNCVWGFYLPKEKMQDEASS
jgi:hypothetical protein